MDFTEWNGQSEPDQTYAAPVKFRDPRECSPRSVGVRRMIDHDSGDHCAVGVTPDRVGISDGARWPPPANEGARWPPPANEGARWPPPANEGARWPPPANEGDVVPQGGVHVYVRYRDVCGGELDEDVSVFEVEDATRPIELNLH